MILKPGQNVSDLPGPALEGQVEATNVAVLSFAGGVYEQQSVECASFAAAAQADYFVIEDTAGQTFAVWLDKDANGTAPTGAAYVASDVQIEVDIVTGNTSSQVADAVKAALELESAFTAVMSVSIEGAVLTITQVLPGEVSDPAIHSADDLADGSFVVATVLEGELPSLNSKYFLFSSPSVNYYAWFNVNGGGVDPSVATRTGVEVACTGNESAIDLAVLAAAQIDALSGVNCEADSGKILIRADSKEDVLSASSGDSGMSVEILAQGTVAYNNSPAGNLGATSNQPSIISSNT